MRHGELVHGEPISCSANSEFGSLMGQLAYRVFRVKTIADSPALRLQRSSRGATQMLKDSPIFEGGTQISSQIKGQTRG